MITRDEVVALLFNVSDIAASLPTSNSFSRTRMAKKTTKADRERREQMLKNAEHTRRLAEKAQAELDRRSERKT
ncbi:MAG: hypothetical protein ABR521_08745 [Gaiellaceae bacterium]